MQVRVTPSGIMDKDTDVSYINQGNYTDANNIRHRQTDGGNFDGVMPIKGNSLKYTIPGYTSAQKKYRFYIDISDIVSGELSSHDANLFISFVYSGTGPIPATYGGSVTYAGTSISDVVSTIQSSITSAVSPLTGITFSVAPPGGYTGNTAYFDMYWSGQDFIITVENTQGTYASVYLLEEYLTSSGNFNVVGSEQIDNDLFLFLASDTMTGDYSLVSEIGVLYSTNNDSTFNYTKLIRSKKLNFSKNRKIEIQSEKTTNQISFYLTDGLNKPRVIYLKYANKRTDNGLLFPQGGRYELENIGVESCLFFPAPSSYLTDIEVIDNAGSLTAGNKRYTGRFLSDDLVPGDFLYPTNPINIFNAELDKPHLITGNTSDTITAKSVRLALKNIPINIYKYFELVAIEYAGESFTAKIVQRFKIPKDADSLVVEHTERGQENIQLGSNELVAISQKYISAKSLKIFDNRMTLSNLEEESDLDLSFWAQKIKHQINKKTIPFIGYLDNPQGQNISFNLNEYINPNNVLNNTSYMFNDTYRFGIQVQWKETGKWSLPYWIDDIIINTSSTNIIGNRRVAPTFTDANITTSFASGNDVNIFYVKFSNILLDDIEPTTNKPIKDLIQGFRIVRSERIPEVLATGLFFMGASFTAGGVNVYPYFNSMDTTPTRDNYPHSYTRKGVTVGTASPSDQWITSTERSDYLFFYSPDFYFNKEGSNYEFNAADQVKLLGVPGTSNMRMFDNAGVYFSTYLELDGNIGTPTNNGFQSFTPTNHVFLDDGQSKTLAAKTVVAGAIEFDPVPVSPATVAGTYTNKTCRSVNVFKLSTAMNSYSEWSAAGRNSKSNGYFYGQLFRDLGGNKKYPTNKELTTYQSTGHYRVLAAGENGALTESVFGGDVYNQKTYMLLRMGGQISPYGVGGAGFLVGVYTQNVLNTQMFNYEEWDGTENGSGFAYPQYIDRQTTGDESTFYTFTGSPGSASVCARGTIGTGLARYMNQWLAVSNNNKYEKSYDFKDGTIIETGFNADKEVINDLPSRITWSAKKILNSPIDNYRIFKPLDFIDLDLTAGEISHHEIINNNLYTFQEKSVQRQYFRDASAISSSGGSDIVIGSGNIMASRGQEISNVGTSKKWSVIKGKTKTGKETAYWFNDRLQRIMRFGEDGTRLISEKGLVSFLVNNGKFISDEYHSLTSKGIHGIWNDRYNEAIFTFKYNDGVSNKAFTLVFDETKNGFVGFHSYYPNIYLPYNNSFFSVNPSNQNQIYLHDSGSESTFYGTAQDANIEMVMNYDPNVSKIFEALQVSSEQKPYAANFTTKNHISYLVQNDFELREDLYYSTIKNDSTGTGLNSGNTSKLWGRWLKIKINVKSSSVGQKLINAIVKFRPMARLYNT